MKFTIGTFYKIVIDVNDRILTYFTKVTSVDEDFVTFTDRYDVEYNYNKKNIVSFRTLSEEEITKMTEFKKEDKNELE